MPSEKYLKNAITHKMIWLYKSHDFSQKRAREC